MPDKLMYIPNDDTQITQTVDYNRWMNLMETKLNEKKQ